MEKDINLIDALTGYSFKITHLDGREVIIESKKGDMVKPGDLKEVPRQGMPIYGRTYDHGSLFIKYNLIFPDTLNTNQINTIRTILIPTPEPTSDSNTEKAIALPIDYEKLHKRQEEQRYNHHDDEDDDHGHGHSHGHGDGGFRTNCSQQ